MSDQAAAENPGAQAETAATSLETLKPRTELKGKVTRVELAGARVDIGVGVDALLHVSMVKSEEPVMRLADVLKAGDEITVYVTKVDPATKRVELTMHKPPVWGWDNLQPGMKLADLRVVSVTKFGIFVSIDGPKDALLPHELVRLDLKLRAGDVIDGAWVTQVDEAKNRIGLTMIEPAALPWEKIHKGDVLRGRVTRIDRGAAYVEVNAEREGQIRMSGFGVGFGSPSDFVEIGEEIDVRVLRVDSQRKMLDLAMMGINADDYALSSGPEETMSPIEAAMRRAQSRKAATTGQPPPQAPSKAKKQQAQADAIARTLAMLQQQKDEAAKDAAKKE